MCYISETNLEVNTFDFTVNAATADGIAPLGYLHVQRLPGHYIQGIGVWRVK